MKIQSTLNRPGVLPLLLGALLWGCGGEKVVGDGLPGTPSAVRAEAADAMALVSWTPPTTDGGNPLLYYLVRCEPVCGGAIVAADQMQATVRGLNNGIPYTFKVSAVNTRGEGPHSIPTEFVTPMAGAEVANPTAPGQPRAVRATAGNSGVYVSWLAPATFGGRPLRSYRVTAEPGGATVTVPPTESMAFIPGLFNGLHYRVKVVASNEVGEGPEALSAKVMPHSGGEPASWVAGYYVGYQRGLLPMDSVDFSGMTHLIVGRFKPGPFGTVSADLDVTEYEGPIIAKELATRAHQAGRKALMMLGGYGEHDNFVPATTPERRPILVRNLIKLMDELGYDGIDIDWEPINLPPVGNDGEQLLALLDDLRAARPGIILAVPVYWVNSNYGISEQEKAFMRELSARVDQLNIMSYKMSGNWGGWESWHSSPLEDEAPNRPTSVASSVRGYLDAGVPAGRIGVGIGFFGTCMRGVTEPRTPLADRDVVEVQSDNAMSYTNIMQLYYEPDSRRWDEKAKSPYLSFTHESGPGRCNFITYEDEQSIAAKGRYLRKEGLGGAIIWTINQGHLPLEPQGKKDPLLDAVKRAFLDR
ncbi:glycosyl hydrolase family 18 protein [Myxococcus sp. RHSTA-1-4]|uniref:glycosyl hydrolase family 18 protein n=1 Tax=Myxococcus sp. RHSTA-1-4 TaxID=2874601 RepID=UPI001CBCE3F3|nr:glycosyl hydrolase family 18 protein [Myxococcus sp. RHSTA-1-4]MBZ4420578.1 fibronectin type III domain-containing protein [Myxococcus sp. RHSTA-1-4]